MPQQEPAPRVGWRPTFEPAIGTSDAQLLANLGNDGVVNGLCFWDPTQGYKGDGTFSPLKRPSGSRVVIGQLASASRSPVWATVCRWIHQNAYTQQLSSARRGTVSAKDLFQPRLHLRPADEAPRWPRRPRRHHGCVSDRRTSDHRAPLLLSNAAPVFKRDGRHHCRIFIAIVAIVGLPACRAIRKVTLKPRKIQLRACNLRGPPRPSGDWLFNWPLHTPWSTWSDAEHH